MKLTTSQTRSRSLAAKSPRNILCLAIDRLNADFLGAYGNAQTETLAFDSLAAESVVFDSYFSTSLDLDALYRAFWRGESPATFDADAPIEEDPARPSLFKALKEQGYRTFIVSDVESVALHPCAEDDARVGRFFLGAPDAEAPVEALEDAKFFRNFEELARFIVKLEDERRVGDSAPWFVWAHFSGWSDVWDFPLERREKFREDEEDPEPYSGVRPPFARRESNARDRRRTVAVERDADPDDLRQSVVEAYSGGISVFDETLEGFVQLITEKGILNKTLFALVGTRGFATGAPSALGIAPEGERNAFDAPFYAEEVRLPLAIRLPDGTGATVRLPGLCEPRDVFATLRDYGSFAAELASEEFWSFEKVEISPFAGVWTAEDQDANASKPALENRSTFDASKPDVPGQNLLRLLADEDGAVRDRALIVARDAKSEERALVVDDWFLKSSPVPANEEDESAPTRRNELFVRPDDRYTVNDVADRCVEIVESLAPALYPGR